MKCHLPVRRQQASDMNSYSFASELTCSICLDIFTDPVTLLCGHSFCRTCLTGFLDNEEEHLCPQCRTSVPSVEEVTGLCTNFVLLSLAEKAKRKCNITKGHIAAKDEVAEMCPKHDEKLKLYCVTDGQLICVICRDGEWHKGHTFKPIEEAAALLKNDLVKGLDRISGPIKTLESAFHTREEKLVAIKTRSCQLLSQISAQFEEMHQFLRKRENELSKEVKRQQNTVVKELNTINAALYQSETLQAKVGSVLDIADHSKFLKGWAEVNVMLQNAYQLSAKDFSVEQTSLSLGPYESHLKFFIWKEMLQVIKPREEQFTLKGEEWVQSNLSVDRRSLLHSSPIETQYPVVPKSHIQYPAIRKGILGDRSYRVTRQKTIKPVASFASTVFPTSSYHGFATSVNKFTSGQHYWEIEVGHTGETSFWEVGIQDHFIKHHGGRFSINCPEGVTPLTLQFKPKRIGIYLDISSQKLSFYNAVNMTRIGTVSTKKSQATSVSAVQKISYDQPNIIPFTVCWY
ncbi:nuclear factor 7, ovary-like [Syngnathus acus]|uniref:nuclear factor 7, ovary-like n=1 Tax=Syngnathus acus TaxID=161584 RepID=UPI001885D888|nr:nuclear factor 7, ovary-like [Syngnathus acus]